MSILKVNEIQNTGSPATPVDFSVAPTINMQPLGSQLVSVDGAVIGGTTPAAGTFTDLTSTGNTTIGNASTDLATLNSQLSSNGSVGTLGQVLSSRGTSQSPSWKSIPDFQNSLTAPTVRSDGSPLQEGDFWWKTDTDFLYARDVSLNSWVLSSSTTLSMRDYSELRAYNGNRTQVLITGDKSVRTLSNVYGTFQLKLSDTTSLDNNGTIVVDALGRRWERLNVAYEILADWFELDNNGVTDNSVNLLKMRDYLRSVNAAAAWNVKFAPNGKYAYTNNRWLNNLINVTVDANGSELYCTGTGTFAGDNWPFGPRECMFRTGGELLVSSAGFAVTTGDTINSANAGASTIVLTSNVFNYVIGDRIFIFGYAIGNVGYSPNFEYFEWNRITNIVGNTITLEKALKHSYSTLWPDYQYLAATTVNGVSVPASFVGAPRVLKLDNRPQVDGTFYNYPEKIELKNMVLPKNPNTTISYRAVVAARQVLWDNVSFGNEVAFDCRESENVNYKSSDGQASFEIDKLLYSVVFEDGSVLSKGDNTSVRGGVTARSVTLKNSLLAEGVIASAVDSMIIENCKGGSLTRSNDDNNGPFMPSFPGGDGGAYAEVKGCTSFKLSNQLDVGLNILKFNRTMATVDPVDGTFTMTFNLTSAASFDGCRPGKKIWVTNQPRVVGIVQDVIRDGANVKVRFSSGNLSHSIISGFITAPINYSYSGNEKLVLNGEVWNPRTRFEDINTGLLNWATFFKASPGMTVNGVALVGNGTGAVGQLNGFRDILEPVQTYRLTYDLVRTAGSVVIRDGTAPTNLATLSADVTNGTVDFTTILGTNFDVRFSGFTGTFTPKSLVRI